MKQKIVMVILQKLKGTYFSTQCTVGREDEMEAARFIVDTCPGVVAIHMELASGKYLESRFDYKGARIFLMEEFGTYQNQKVRHLKLVA